MDIPSKVRKVAKQNPLFGSVLEAAQEAGWEVGLSKNSHIRLRSPDGRTYFFSSTPSDYRAARNFRSVIRRAGLTVR